MLAGIPIMIKMPTLRKKINTTASGILQGVAAATTRIRAAMWNGPFPMTGINMAEILIPARRIILGLQRKSGRSWITP